MTRRNPNTSSRRSRRELLLPLTLFVAITAVACATVQIHQRVRSGALAKALIFGHAEHIENQDCSDCHKGIEKSEGLRTPTLMLSLSSSRITQLWPCWWAACSPGGRAPCRRR